MFEPQLTHFDGVVDIDISIVPDKLQRIRHPSGPNTDGHPDTGNAIEQTNNSDTVANSKTKAVTNDDARIPLEALLITVYFASSTDSKAWIKIDGSGKVAPAFGGTGTRRQEVEAYARKAIRIWRAITNDHDTTCYYYHNGDKVAIEDA